ncbi:uncharacterized protein EAF02_005549 [Botrytis sinoallii]|uniref:uncharacterized protein n=1 Tax=Botrytis sinoallii TaxID=1463999 RepID=UPI0018FF5AC2|nr:uncharacterized protein EAF02_005549 [Botrytis sinoallii]KAF7883629.1 hypothetical protein EAF02_005549 [Botrytis sinoallii]
MSPSVIEAISETTQNIREKIAPQSSDKTNNDGTKSQEAPNSEKLSPSAVAPSGTPQEQHREPLKLSGTLDKFESFDVTPIIGREYVGVNLAEWIHAPSSDDLLRDLAITISQRGVVFFRKQDDITNDLQKELVQRLGELSGKPSTSKLHIHPVSNSGREHGGKDDEISIYDRNFEAKHRQSAKEGWHSDITFEPIPSDYALLRLTELPKTGGDTLWASGYEVYDRISKPVQKFLETLTATYAQPEFNKAAEKNGFKLYSAERGAPENVGEKLEAVHPVVRTNPVTGWKSIFALGHHVSHINELTTIESDALLTWFLRLVVDNHDLQVRHRWENVNDLAIWDKQYHVATSDYINLGLGERAWPTGCERPYLDPESTGRREGLEKLQSAE